MSVIEGGGWLCGGDWKDDVGPWWEWRFFGRSSDGTWGVVVVACIIDLVVVYGLEDVVKVVVVVVECAGVEGAVQKVVGDSVVAVVVIDWLGV